MKKYEFSQSMFFSIERDEENKIKNIEEIASIEKTSIGAIVLTFPDNKIVDPFIEAIRSWDLYYGRQIKLKDNTIICSIMTTHKEEENSKFLSLLVSFMEGDFKKR